MFDSPFISENVNTVGESCIFSCRSSGFADEPPHSTSFGTAPRVAAYDPVGDFLAIDDALPTASSARQSLRQLDTELIESRELLSWIRDALAVKGTERFLHELIVDFERKHGRFDRSAAVGA